MFCQDDNFCSGADGAQTTGSTSTHCYVAHKYNVKLYTVVIEIVVNVPALELAASYGPCSAR